MCFKENLCEGKNMLLIIEKELGYFFLLIWLFDFL